VDGSKIILQEVTVVEDNPKLNMQTSFMMLELLPLLYDFATIVKVGWLILESRK